MFILSMLISAWKELEPKRATITGKHEESNLSLNDVKKEGKAGQSYVFARITLASQVIRISLTGWE